MTLYNTFRGMPYLNIPVLIENAKKQNSCGLRARNKLEVLKRDGFKCVICGRTYTLTIAHITPPIIKRHRGASSYIPEDCNTLCVECHQNEDRAIHIIRSGGVYEGGL